MLARVRRTLVERRLVARGSRVLVACSGGPDSSALVHALHALAPELGFALEIASVDHGLRPEAAGEVAAVGRYAASLALPFHPIRITVPAGSIQAAARHARYAALHEVADARRCECIAVGHTRDDQAETVLGRLLRGAGVFGLAGVKPKREDGVIRPLLDCTRADVLAYVARHGLPTIDDPSNRDPVYRRVRLRHDLLPRLEEEDPRVREHLGAIADEVRELAEAIEALAARWVHGLDLDLDASRLAIDVTTLLGEPRAVRREALRTLLERIVGRRLGRSHVLDVESLLHRDGSVWLPHEVSVTRDGPRIVVERSSQRIAGSRRRNT